MKRGGSSGGGQSSLGYLFGSDNNPKNEVAPPSPTVFTPPYGTEIDINHKPPQNPSPSQQSNSYPKTHGQYSGIFITGRPSTKVKSAPGGDSSLGYLFGDN